MESKTMEALIIFIALIVAVVGVWRLPWAGAMKMESVASLAESADPASTPSPESMPANSKSICAIDNDGPIERGLIDKIQGGYSVYVQPFWYAMPFDWKQAAAEYIAECELTGAARIVDASTGRLLARWGANGYVNYEGQ